MDTAKAFALGAASRNSALRVFDWDKAAQMIKDRHPSDVSAGLRDDWEWTGGTIYKDGAPDTESYTYLGSRWAIPEIDVDGDVSECWRWEEPGEDFDTIAKWPASALAILDGEKE